MTRRSFLRNAAIATVVAPAIPEAVARATTPGARQLLFVDSFDLVWRRTQAFPVYDFIGGSAECAAFKRMWENGMKKYYDECRALD